MQSESGVDAESDRQLGFEDVEEGFVVCGFELELQFVVLLKCSVLFYEGEISLLDFAGGGFLSLAFPLHHIKELRDY